MDPKSVSDIFDHFGDTLGAQARAIAEKLGANFQTVRSWPRRGAVPDEWKFAFAKACQDSGLEITVEDLTRISAQRIIPEKYRTTQPEQAEA